jgi:hypothetical protein
LKIFLGNSNVQLRLKPPILKSPFYHLTRDAVAQKYLNEPMAYWWTVNSLVWQAKISRMWSHVPYFNLIGLIIIISWATICNSSYIVILSSSYLNLTSPTLHYSKLVQIPMFPQSTWKPLSEIGDIHCL